MSDAPVGSIRPSAAVFADNGAFTIEAEFEGDEFVIQVVRGGGYLHFKRHCEKMFLATGWFAALPPAPCPRVLVLGVLWSRRAAHLADLSISAYQLRVGLIPKSAPLSGL